MFRDAEKAELVRQSEAKRFRDSGIVDLIIKYDEMWIIASYRQKSCLTLKNTIGKRIKYLMSDKMNHMPDNLDKLEAIKRIPVDEVTYAVLESYGLGIEELKAYSKHVSNVEHEHSSESATYLSMRNTLIDRVGNILDPSVPVSQTEDDNLLIEEYNLHTSPNKLSHIDLLQKIGGVDYDAGINVAGNRGYYLKGAAVFLAQALIQLSLRILGDKGYTPVQPPYFMRHDMLERVSQLNDFSDRLYKVVEGYDAKQEKHNGANPNEQDSALYLIATSEQPLVALNYNKKLEPADLPIRYAGYSACFRTETGRHGQDTRGIFRVHQFDKIEQFVVCSPNPDDEFSSDKMFEEMLGNCKALLQSLNIPYRIISIVSKELNLAASIKYDIEGLFVGGYRELVSCSNCTDYQARAVNTTISTNTDYKVYAHMLNSTMCAVPRMICAVLESNQTEDGIVIPEALKPYMPERYKSSIPYVA